MIPATNDTGARVLDRTVPTSPGCALRSHDEIAQQMRHDMVRVLGDDRGDTMVLDVFRKYVVDHGAMSEILDSLAPTGDEVCQWLGLRGNCEASSNRLCPFLDRRSQQGCSDGDHVSCPGNPGLVVGVRQVHGSPSDQAAHRVTDQHDLAHFHWPVFNGVVQQRSDLGC